MSTQQAIPQIHPEELRLVWAAGRVTGFNMTAEMLNKARAGVSNPLCTPTQPGFFHVQY